MDGQNIYGEIDASIQSKIEADNDFQTQLADLDDESRETAIKDKKIELFNQELSERMKKDKELADNYKIRAEKAEKEAKKTSRKDDDTSKNASGNLSLKDIRALNNVHEDDLDEVMDYAAYKKLSPAEALKSPAIVALLKAKEDERKTAQAINTGGGRRGSAQISDEKILEDFSNGKFSDDESDIERLANARHNARKNKK